MKPFGAPDNGSCEGTAQGRGDQDDQDAEDCAHDKLNIIAQALMEHETLDADAFYRLMEGKAEEDENNNGEDGAASAGFEPEMATAAPLNGTSPVDSILAAKLPHWPAEGRL